MTRCLMNRHHLCRLPGASGQTVSAVTIAGAKAVLASIAPSTKAMAIVVAMTHHLAHRLAIIALDVITVAADDPHDDTSRVTEMPNGPPWARCVVRCERV